MPAVILEAPHRPHVELSASQIAAIRDAAARLDPDKRASFLDRVNARLRDVGWRPSDDEIAAVIVRARESLTPR